MAFFNNLLSRERCAGKPHLGQGSRQQVLLKRAASRKVRSVPAGLILAGHFLGADVHRRCSSVMRNRIDIVREEPISIAKSAEAEGDAELVRRAQQGEKEAFAMLVCRHEQRVYWIVQGILQNQADSEEVLQESFLKALKHIRGFRGEARFSTWLIQIAINEARMRQRKYRPGLYDSLDEERDDPSGFRPRELADWRASPEEAMAKEEMGLLLQRAIRSLPKIYREVFLLRDAEHLSN